MKNFTRAIFLLFIPFLVVGCSSVLQDCKTVVAPIVDKSEVVNLYYNIEVPFAHVRFNGIAVTRECKF